MAMYSFGVDIGGTTVKIGFFEASGSLLESWEIPTRTVDNGKNILPDIAASVLGKLKELGIDDDYVKGIGMGVPGPVSDDGTVLKCVNLGWGVFNVCDELSKLTGMPVRATNDANAAALGEMWQGGGKGHKDVIMVTLGTGVGGGIIIDGRIMNGVNGASGEIGHIPVQDFDEETEVCGCGKRGCLEQYVSANGIARITKKYLQENPELQSTLRYVPTIDSRAIFDAAKDGDEVALHMVDVFSKILGRALAGVACVIDTEIFVVGGGVSKAGQIVIEGVQKYYRQYAFHASSKAQFALATLGNNAGIYGGAALML